MSFQGPTFLWPVYHQLAISLTWDTGMWAPPFKMGHLEWDHSKVFHVIPGAGIPMSHVLWVGHQSHTVLRFHCATNYLTFSFHLRVRSRTLCAQWTCYLPRTRLPRILAFRIARATGSRTRTFPFPFHVFSYLYGYGLLTRPRLLVCFMVPLSSRRLIYLHFPLMPVSFCLVNSSLCLPVLVCRLVSRLVILGL